MSYATLGSDSAVERAPVQTCAVQQEMLLAARQVSDHLQQTDLSVPELRCGGCIHRIETELGRLPGVEGVRANLSTKRVAIRWRTTIEPPPLIEKLRELGYDAYILDAAVAEKDPKFHELLRALAVAGFAAGNIMLFSVSVWAGAEPATRDLFHWLSALIAMPALVYSGRVFFVSAWRALRHGRTNMDVPISIGVLLATGMSFYDTLHHGPHAYFDAAITLLFFLLVGRTLDHAMRARAQDAVTNLARLSPRGAMIVRDDGACDYVPVGDIRPGMTIRLRAGERVPVDARVAEGCSDIDMSLVSGEAAPVAVSKGSTLQAGTLNLTGPLSITATAAARDSFLAEMTRLMEAAGSARSGYRRIADRAARLYAPFVHLAALLSFAGWMTATGDAHRSITIAIAVLIITCPCALGLAVPMVQVVAARRLFACGIMMKDGSGLERLAEIDTVIFDKTGALTRGTPHLVQQRTADPAALSLAAAIAAHSSHPYARALTVPEAGQPPVPFERVSEHPGLGLEAIAAATVWRLGRPEWALAGNDAYPTQAASAGTVLSRNGELVAQFGFRDPIRDGASEAIAGLRRLGLNVGILSGDRQAAVEEVAAAVGVTCSAAEILPGDKVRRVTDLRAEGHSVLMVGDGLNDAPALAAAHVSMAPATAADIGRNAADFVFLRESLQSVPFAVAIAVAARRLIQQNFILAVAYNLLAIPIAVLGYVTPLLAALAMSLSSVIVVANALRLKGPAEDAGGALGDRPARSPSLLPSAAE